MHRHAISRIFREGVALLAALALVLAGLVAAVRPHATVAGMATAGLPICAPFGQPDGLPASPEDCQHCILCKLNGLQGKGFATSMPVHPVHAGAVALAVVAETRPSAPFDARGPPGA